VHDAHVGGGGADRHLQLCLGYETPEKLHGSNRGMCVCMYVCVHVCTCVQNDSRDDSMGGTIVFVTS